MRRVGRIKRYTAVLAIFIIIINLSLLENQIGLQNNGFWEDPKQEESLLSKSPFSAKYNEVYGNSTGLNVTGTYFGNNFLSDFYIPNVNSANYSIPVIENGAINSVNFSINAPEVINSGILVVNDSLGYQPNYTIQWNNQEFIRENATFTISANSSSVYPLGNISVYINNSESMNFTGDGTYSFNVTRNAIQDVNVTVKFFYDNNTLYSEEEMIVSFYDIFNISLNSIIYEIRYTQDVYKNQNGSIEVDLTNGTNSTVGFINITMDSIQKWSFFGDGIHNINFNEDILGDHEFSVLIYTDDNNLYANETFNVDIIEPVNDTIVITEWGSTIIDITYNKYSKIDENATIWIQTTNLIDKYSHGNISVFIDTIFEKNYTGEGDHFLNVSSLVSGNVNVSIDFYNNTNEYNQSIQFNISFFNDFNYTTIQGINYTIIYPFYYYIGHNATINLLLNDGTNSTLGNMGLYYNNILNSSFGGSGIYSNNITTFEAILENITLELNYSGNKWFYNESFQINFIEKPEISLDPRFNIVLTPDNGFNTSTKEYLAPEAYAMEFTLDQISNITGFNLFCDYYVPFGRSLSFELRNNTIDGELIANKDYTLLFPSGTNTWKYFDFEINNINSGIYYLIVDCSGLGGMIIYDYFSWAFAPGEINVHNASYYNNSQWQNCNTDFLMKVNYNYWQNTTFDEISVNGTLIDTEIEMNKINSELVYLNFTENDGPWYPNEGIDYIPINFTTNQTCRFNVTFDISYEVSQLTNNTHYLILNTSQIENILWNVTFPGVEYNYLNFQDVEIIQYNATIHIPQSWFALNGTSQTYSEEFDDVYSITFNHSASIENWNLTAISIPSNSLIEIYEIIGAVNPQRTPGDNITAQCTVFGNSANFKANLSVWKDNDLKYNITHYDNTEIFNFSTWGIPLGYESGEYELFFYWSNGTDVAYNETTFVIKEKANFTSNVDYVDINYMENATFILSYQDFYNGNNISDGQIESNWTNDWSYNYTDGYYYIELNSTGMEKGTRWDVNLSISSPLYKNESLLLSIYVLVPTALDTKPDGSNLITVVNRTFVINATYYSEFDLGGVDNSTSSFFILASIDGISIPITTIPAFGDPNPKKFMIVINLMNLTIFPQSGNRQLVLKFFFENSTTHYLTKEKIYNITISPQECLLEPISSNAHDSTDLFNLFEYVDQRTHLEIQFNLKKLTPVNYSDFLMENINNITINAQIDSSMYTLDCIGDGLYLFNESIELFEINTEYQINFTVDHPDLTKHNLIIHYQIIKRLKIDLNLDFFPQTIKQFTTIPISGYISIINGTQTIPFQNVPVRIIVEFFGVSGHNVTEYIIYTSVTGRFFLNNLTSPNADDYLSVVIRVQVDETRYTEALEESVSASIIKLSLFQIIAIAISIIVAIIILSMILYVKVISPISKNKTHREIEGDIFMLKSKDTRREELKSRLENYIRVPSLVEGSEVSATSMPTLGKDVNMIVLPPDETDDKPQKRSKQSDDNKSEFLNRDILLYRKEKYLSNALKSEQMGHLESASDCYEKAALYSEKLGQYSESIVYLKKVEILNKKIKEDHKNSKGESKFISFVKSKFKPRDTTLVEDMKIQAKNLNAKIFKNITTKKNVTLPFAKKQDHDDYLEYKKLMEDFED